MKIRDSLESTLNNLFQPEFFCLKQTEDVANATWSQHLLPGNSHNVILRISVLKDRVTFEHMDKGIRKLTRFSLGNI